uniref:Oxoglutarate receptor 1 n=1 Tax=Sinocyclocheilus grahami TaxID=75366 RepID=A0A672LB27_SINGR
MVIDIYIYMKQQKAMTYYLPVMYSIISLVGLMGNLLAIVIYLAKLRPWKSSSIIMVNLAVADLLYALSLPVLVQFYITRNWTFGEFMCRCIRFCFYYNLYGSILFLTCLSLFRYIAVVYPLKAAEIRRKIWGTLACLAVWAVSLVEIGPMLGMITVQQKDNLTKLTLYMCLLSLPINLMHPCLKKGLISLKRKILLTPNFELYVYIDINTGIILHRLVQNVK